MTRFAPSLMLSCAIAAFLSCGAPPAARAGDSPTAMLSGPLGLNTVPSARMDAAGTVSANIATMDPYMHTSAGIQILDPIYIGVRQTAEISSLREGATGLYPGIDLKLRLARETKYRPEIAVGVQSLFGHKRMAGEYLALSKRYKDFDFTGGIAWGRLGSAGHIKNPLKIFGDHFDKNRALDGGDPTSLGDLFTGEEIGLFGGVEYFTPLDGLSLKADWGADQYIIEKTASDYNPPNPWALGVNYAPAEWVNAQISLIGGEKVMAGLTLKSPLSRYPRAKEMPSWLRKDDTPVPLSPHRTDEAAPKQMELSAQAAGIGLYDTRRDTYTAWGKLHVTEGEPLPQQIGRAARHMANNAGPSVEKIMITPVIYGIDGETISIMRRDIEHALIHHQGSPEEIWRNATFGDTPPDDLLEGIEQNIYRGSPHAVPWHFRIVQDNQISLSEDDSGLLYRAGLLFETREQAYGHIMYGAGLRVDIADNLQRLRKYRPVLAKSTRGNVEEFADRTIGLEHLYLSYFDNPRKDVFTAITAGYVDEMYGGVNGEILFRPFGKTFAIGANGFAGLKRDPKIFLNNGLFIDQAAWTAHINAYYEMPATDLTFKAQIGRYLAGDFGGQVSMQKRFDNGVALSAFVTATDQADYDVFGSKTNLYSGIQISLPLGGVKYMPKGSEIRTTIVPFGRNTAQNIDNPVDLYELTEPISYRHIGQYWGRVLD